MRMHENLTVTFELAGVTVEVPNKSGVKQGEPQAPKLFNFVMQACLESLGESWQAGSLKFHTNTKISGARGGKVLGNNWRKSGEFSFEIWCSLYANDAELPQNKRNKLLIAANDVDDHLQLFGLLMHVGRGGMRAKTEALFLPARGRNTDGDTSDLILNSGGTVSFCSQFTYLGSIVHEDLSDKHDVANRIKKATAAFGALRKPIFGTKYVPLKIKRQLYVGGVLSVLLFGCESWCVTMEMLTLLRNWHNARICEMCRVTMRHVELHRISSVELQQRIGIWDLDYYLARRTLLWVGHVTRMPKSRLPRRLLTAWVGVARPAFGQEMTFGRSLERWLERFDLPLIFTEWAQLAQSKVDWAKRIGLPRPSTPSPLLM